MLRSNRAGDLLYDPEIERSARARRAQARAFLKRLEEENHTEGSSDDLTSSEESQASNEQAETSNVNPLYSEEEMEDDQISNHEEEEQQRPPPHTLTLRQLSFPQTMNMRPTGIVLPTTTGNWELRANFISILPKFHDHPGEDPQRHLQDFEMACETQRTRANGTGEYIRLVSFSFHLVGQSSRKVIHYSC